MIGGSTGEAPLLTAAELGVLIETARTEAPARVAVIAGCGAESTRATIELCALAAARGADAVLVRSPAYYRDQMSPAVLRTHFHAVADASSLPVIVYSIPRYVPVELAPELIGRLVEHDNIVGVKDSSGDLKTVAALVDGCAGNGAVLAGAGTLLYPALELGATGGVLGVAVLASAACVELVRAFRSGRTVEAGRLQERIGPLHKAIVGRGGIAAIKAALDRLGLYGGPPRPPLLPLTDRERARVDRALRAAGLLSDSA